MSETFDRSLSHWSAEGRGNMEDFYALATLDYRVLAGARDWKGWFAARQARVGGRSLRLLDVACGSGKFPTALVRHAGVAEAAIQPVDYGLLDPSDFSLAEARGALTDPFRPGQEFHTTLQGLDCDAGAFDLAWAVHALYAIPEEELDTALERFLHAIGPEGGGVIAHACAESHYTGFYRRYIAGFRDGQGTPYSTAEQILASLDRLGAPHGHEILTYENRAMAAQAAQVEGFLQRCVFDGSIGLEAMLGNRETGPYLESCRTDDGWAFQQRVALIEIRA